MSTADAVTAAPDPHADTTLPLHQRTVFTTVLFFYCSKCRREVRFSWLYAYCTERGELICYGCGGSEKFRVCRRCRQPRRARGNFTGSQTVCDGCPGAHTHSGEPLQVMCDHCKNPFTAKRSDAKFCSGRCRTAAHRSEKRGNAQGDAQ